MINVNQRQRKIKNITKLPNIYIHTLLTLSWKNGRKIFHIFIHSHHLKVEQLQLLKRTYGDISKDNNWRLKIAGIIMTSANG